MAAYKIQLLNINSVTVNMYVMDLSVNKFYLQLSLCFGDRSMHGKSKSVAELVKTLNIKAPCHIDAPHYTEIKIIG